MSGEIYGVVSSLGLLATAVILMLHARFVYLTGKDLQKSCAKLDRALKRLDTNGEGGGGVVRGTAQEPLRAEMVAAMAKGTE